MKLRLSTNNIQLKLDSTDDLEFQDIFKAYNLVMRRNDSLSVDDDQPEKSESKDDPKNLIKYERPYHEIVKVGIECPQCGYVGTETTRMGFRFIKCPTCFTKLFLKPANGEWGVKDDKGMTYRAIELFHDRTTNNNDEYSKMFSHSDDPSKPDVYSTISEIEKYLDDNGIDHKGVHLKGLLLDRVKEAKTK